MKRNIFILLITIFIVNILPAESDDILVHNIAEVLIKEYDNYQDKTFLEKMVLKYGKKTFIDSVRSWELNYKNLDEMKIKLHPTIENIVKVGDKNLSPENAIYFRSLFENLTLLGFKNIQIYYESTKKYLSKYGDQEVTIHVIDEASIEPEFYELKVKLYDEEKITKNEIRKMFRNEKIKYKLAFYSFAFDFLDKIRTSIEDKNIEKMKLRIQEKGIK